MLESDLIIKIDEYIMKKAMRDFKHWQENSLNPGILSLNLSLRQLSKPNYVQRLKEILEEEDFEQKFLKLEMLEREMMTNVEDVIEKLHQIRQLGIKIAIDDFGTGYSSLAYLHKFPITLLKIDRSFIKDIPYSSDSMGICKAIVSLAEGLNIPVLAEGVETKEQVEFLIQNRCYTIQGYYFSKPIPSQNIEKLLRESKEKKDILSEFSCNNLLEFAQEIREKSQLKIEGEILVRADDGTPMWLKEKIIPLYDENQKFKKNILIRYDITNEKELEQISVIDTLTSLYNRRSFNTILEDKIKETRSSKSTLALLILNIDMFNEFNNSYGYNNGDNVLEKISNLIKRKLKKNNDIAFRLGGDEFAILFSPSTQEKAIALAEDIYKEIIDLDIEHSALIINKLTVSVGIIFVDFSDEYVDAQNFYTMANDALLKSKKNGRNQITLYENEDIDFF